MNTSSHFQNLIDQIRNGQVIFWVGSGFSKTSGFLVGSELVERIKKTVNHTHIPFFEKKNNLDDVSEEFIQIYDRKRLEIFLVEEFGKTPETLQYQKQIEKIPQVTKIITTNYDTCFEQVYGERLCKIVFDTDLVKCSKKSKVNLYKIHGDINDPKTIIVSKSDYADLFHNRINPLVWGEIKSLITKSSILFIGYSFDDTNVKLIFDDILEQLGNTHHDFFLISPSLPLHRQNNLKEKYSIKYIDMKIENAIPEILQAIETHFFEDVQKGCIQTPFLNYALKQRHIDANFSFNPDGTLNIKSISGDSEIDVHISYTVSKENFDESVELKDLIEGKKFGDITLSSTKGDIKWSTNIGLNKLFDTSCIKDPSKKVEINIKSKPQKKIEADLGLKDSDLTLNCITGEHYYSQNAFQINLHYFGLDISTKGDKNGFQTFSIKTHPKNVIQGYSLFKFLNEWINGKSLQIFFDFFEKPFEVPIDMIELDQKKIDIISDDFILFSSLFKIQQNFGINFKTLKPISENDYKNIISIQKLINGEKIKIDPVKCTLKPIDNKIFLKTLEDSTGEFKINLPEIKYTIFNKTLSLQNCSIEINDLIYLNKEEIELQIQNLKEYLVVVMGSKTDNILMSYNPK
jgi:hypothetical protein